MTGPTRQRRTAAVATSDGAVLHATIDGRDDAPVTVVLAHGWTLAQAAWDDVAVLLRPQIADGGLRLIPARRATSSIVSSCTGVVGSSSGPICTSCARRSPAVRRSGPGAGEAVTSGGRPVPCRGGEQPVDRLGDQLRAFLREHVAGPLDDVQRRVGQRLGHLP